jgi:hypothetical protein
MRRYGLRDKAYGAVGVLGIGLGIVIALIAAITKIDPKNLSSNWSGLGSFAQWCKDWSPLLVPVMTFGLGICVFMRKWIGAPWVWAAIHDHMNTFCETLFVAHAGDPPDHHRITLFKAFECWEYPCCLERPLEKRLMPVERSGHMTQRSKTSFCVPDKAVTVEGVAGQAYRMRKTVIVNNLPSLAVSSPAADIQEYAQKTWISEKWLRDRLNNGERLARSFCGIPVSVKGKVWGVIIIDSMAPNGVGDQDSRVYDLLGRSLCKLLERV